MKTDNFMMARLFPLFAFILAAGNLASAPLLPEPFDFPKEPKEGTRHSVYGQEAETPRVTTYFGSCLLTLNLESQPVVDHILLLMKIGENPSFFPAGQYQILTSQHRDGMKGHVVVRVGAQKILFEARKGNHDVLKLESTNLPGYSLERNGDCLSLVDRNKRQRYDFSSDDGGYTWLVQSISHMDFPTKRLTCGYDEDGNLVEIAYPDGSKCKLTYENGLVRRVIEPSGRAMTEIGWDDKGQINSVKTWISPKHPFYPMDSVWPGTAPKPFPIRSIRSECDAYGRLASLITTDGNKYSFEFREDADAERKTKYRCAVMKRPDGSKTFRRSFHDMKKGTLTVNMGDLIVGGDGSEEFMNKSKRFYKKKGGAFFEFAREIDGKRCVIERDGKTGLITAREMFKGKFQRYEYDENKTLKEIIRPDKTVVKFEYDEERRLVKKIDADGAATVWRYDDEGLLVEVDESGAVTRYMYDDDKLPVMTILPDETKHRFAWDSLSRLSSYVGPDGVTTKYKYHDGVDEISEIETVSSDGERKMVKKFLYSPRGYLRKIVFPDGKYMAFGYDGGKLARRRDVDGGMVAFVYDDEGDLLQTRVLSRGKGGGTVSTASQVNEDSKRFDKFGRLIKREYDDGTWVAYDYDADGRLIREKFSDRTFKMYEYDDAGRIAAVTGNRSDTARYEYDDAGRLIRQTTTRLSFPDETETTEWLYDSLGRKVKVVYPDGSERRIDYVGKSNKILRGVRRGIVTHYEYDEAGRMSRVGEYPLDRLEEAETEEERDALFEKNVITTFSYDSFGNRSIVELGM